MSALHLPLYFQFDDDGQPCFVGEDADDVSEGAYVLLLEKSAGVWCVSTTSEEAAERGDHYEHDFDHAGTIGEAPEAAAARLGLRK